MHLLRIYFEADWSMISLSQSLSKKGLSNPSAFVYSDSIQPIISYTNSLSCLLCILFYVLSDEQIFVALMRGQATSQSSLSRGQVGIRVWRLPPFL